MATSTEATLRQAIIDELRATAVAQTLLGFDEPSGNVKDYLLDHESKERVAAYLAASVDGRQTVRCWAVEVLGNDDWFGMNNISIRSYQITIQGYYAIGENGEGAKMLIDHSRAVRNVLRGMQSTLDGYVSRVVSTGRPDIRKVSGVDNDTGEILVGTTVYIAERTNPDF